MRWRKVSIVVSAGLVLFALCAAAAGIFLCETTLHPYIKSSVSAAEDGSRARPVSITASDDLKLRAWYRAPVTSNGACAVLLHGVSDTHLGVTGIADFSGGRGLWRIDAGQPRSWSERSRSGDVRAERSL